MKENDGYDGNKLFNWAAFFEMLEQQDMRRTISAPDAWRIVKPTLKDGQVIGKALMVSTVDLDDSGESFRELWNDTPPEKESGLYRLFRPEWDSDEFGLKKQDDENKDNK